MPRQTGIPAALRAMGLTVEMAAGWEFRGSTDFDPQGVTCHWTAGQKTGDRPSLRVCVDGRTGLPGPLCQVFLTRAGVAVVVAAGRANHAGIGGWDGLTGNRSVWGIEAENSGSDPWTDAQRWAYPRAVAALCRLSGIPVRRVHGHSEWAPTRKSDIGTWPMSQMRADVAELLAPPPAPAPPPPPTPSPEEDDMQADERAALMEIRARVMGGIPSGSAEGRTSTKGVPARILDSEDGDYLRVLLLGIADKVGIDIAGVRATLDVHAGAVKDAADALREVADRLTGDDRARIDDIVARLRITLDPTP